METTVKRKLTPFSPNPISASGFDSTPKHHRIRYRVNLWKSVKVLVHSLKNWMHTSKFFRTKQNSVLRALSVRNQRQHPNQDELRSWPGWYLDEEKKRVATNFLQLLTQQDKLWVRFQNSFVWKRSWFLSIYHRIQTSAVFNSAFLFILMNFVTLIVRFWYSNPCLDLNFETEFYFCSSRNLLAQNRMPKKTWR